MRKEGRVLNQLRSKDDERRQNSRNKSIILSNKIKFIFTIQFKDGDRLIDQTKEGKKDPADYCLQETHHTVKDKELI